VHQLTTVLLYDGSLLGGFNVAIKGLRDRPILYFVLPSK